MNYIHANDSYGVLKNLQKWKSARYELKTSNRMLPLNLRAVRGDGVGLTKYLQVFHQKYIYKFATFQAFFFFRKCNNKFSIKR